MTTTPDEPLGDDEMDTTAGGAEAVPGGDADGTDGGDGDDRRHRRRLHRQHRR